MIHEIFLSFILSERFITLNLKIKNLVFFFSPLSKSSIQTYLKANRCPIQFMHFLFKKIKVLEFFAATVDIKRSFHSYLWTPKGPQAFLQEPAWDTTFRISFRASFSSLPKQLTFHHWDEKLPLAKMLFSCSLLLEKFIDAY